MKIIITITTILFLSSIYAQKLEKTYYESGELKSIVEYNDKEIKTSEKIYYKNEALASVKKYNHNEKDELIIHYKKYYRNGNIESVGSFLEISYETAYNKIGEWKYYYINGNLKFTQKYNNKGVKIGELKSYYKNGKLREIGNYSDTRIKDVDDLSGILNIIENRVGEWKKYYKNGQLHSAKNYDTTYDGYSSVKGSIEEFYKNGKLKCFIDEKNELKTYYKNGKLKTIGKYDNNGNKIGEWKTYYKNGRLKSFDNQTNQQKTYYKNGVLRSVGESEFYYKNGKPKFIEEEVLDLYILYDKNDSLTPLEATEEDINIYYNKKNGDKLYVSNSVNDSILPRIEKKYYNNGILEELTKYKKNGDILRKEYYKNGQLKFIENYNKEGQEIGVWKEFFINGQLSFIKKHNKKTDGIKLATWYDINGEIDREIDYESKYITDLKVYITQITYKYPKLKNSFDKTIFSERLYDEKGGYVDLDFENRVKKDINNYGQVVMLTPHSILMLSGTELYPNGKLKIIGDLDGLAGNPYVSENEKIKISKEYYLSGKLKAQNTFYLAGGFRIPANSDYYDYYDEFNDSYLRETTVGVAEEKTYYENEQLKSDGKYYNYYGHTRENEWRFYHKNGQLSETIYFFQDSPVDIYNSFSKNGNIREKGTLQSGDGTIYRYHKNGQIKSIVTYVDLPSEEEFDVNIVEQKTYYENGKLKTFVRYNPINLRSKQILEKKSYYKNGQIKESFTKDKNDEELISFKSYYENGKLKSTGKYIDSYGDIYRIGEWKFYYESGKIRIISNYEYVDEYSYIKEYKLYDKNGKLVLVQ